MSALLPLFPLEVVLVPGEALPLHIFEPRYQEMIGECLRQKQPFGVVRASEKALAEVGCAAEVVEVVKRYDDGRMDILTRGSRRFELLQVNEERSFLRGDVMYFEDEAEDAPLERRQRAVELHRDLLAAAGGEPEENLEPDDPGLSFLLAGSVPLDLDFKQTLLGMRSEAERVKAIIEYYEVMIPRVRRAMRTREKAGGNGHAL